ncbi:MAG: response regulator, partial [Oscillospiraceae bacterium]
MYNLLIADDEFQIRTLLSTVVDWKSLGFNIVGLFEDGQDVIDYITTNHVDCILSDIRMINVSGIELAEYLYTNYPKIKLVLLSGYQEFEYAVSALKFNVENYLLKPTKINDLTSIFSLLKAKLDNEINDMSIISCYRREVFGKLKDGHYKDDETFPSILKSLNIDIELSNSCALVNINFDAPIKVEENIRSTFFQNFALITESNIKGFYISGTSQSVEYILFSTNSSSNNFKDFAQKICECISEFSKTRAKISNFNFFESIKKLQSIEPYAKTNYENIDQILIKEQEKVLISVINSGNSLEVKNQLNMIFNILSMLTLLELKKYVKNLITFTNDELLADDGVSKKKIDDFLNEINS